MDTRIRVLPESFKSPQWETQFSPDKDASAAFHTLKRLEAEVRESREEVERLEMALPRARERHSQAINALTEYQFARSALSRLPSELFSKFFQHCIWEDNGAHVFSRRAMPWVLAQVCRRWRAVALSTKSLWNTIRIDMDLGARRNKQPWVMVNEYFARSEPLPVSCLLQFDRHHDMQVDLQFIEGILGYAPRLRDVSIDFDEREDLFWLWIRNTSDFPLLQTLHLLVSQLERDDFNDGDVEQLPAPVSGGFANAPNLIEAVIQTPVYSFPITVLPWTRLKELECSFHSLEEMCEIAPQLTDLEYWYIDFYWHNVEPTQALAAPITIPKLRLLETHGDPELICTVLNRLRTPALEDLGFNHGYREIDSVAEAQSILSAISHLQDRSLSSIRRLTCPLVLFLSQNSREVAGNLTSMEELCMCLPVFNTKRNFYFHALNALTDPGLLPNVKTLHLDFQKRSEAQSQLFESFLYMVEARRRGSSSISDTHGTLARLERLSFCANSQAVESPLNPERQKRLEDLERGGMVLLGSIVGGDWYSSYRKEVGCSRKASREKRREDRFNL
ncbi:hypothetical protein PQX77_004518 [Marasmius sp. AFHP31]|nr:hypothetical protein PQX77_004518 [Marasmius sp. AFHP31]